MQIRTLVIGAAASFFLCAQAADAAAACTAIAVQQPSHVNVEKVRESWLLWMNDARKKRDIPPVELNDDLNATAGNWATYAVKRGSIDHKRYAKSPYYDYAAIEKWFGKHSMTFANVNHTTFTENIGWGVFKCHARDCTAQAIKAVRTTFDMYMAEKSKKDNPHYRSVMNKDFTVIGVGIATSPVQGRYYVTIHYAAKITSTPDFCPHA